MTSDQPPSPPPSRDAVRGDDPTAPTQRQNDDEALVDARWIRELRATPDGSSKRSPPSRRSSIRSPSSSSRPDVSTDLAAAVTEDLGPPGKRTTAARDRRV